MTLELDAVLCAVLPPRIRQQRGGHCCDGCDDRRAHDTERDRARRGGADLIGQCARSRAAGGPVAVGPRQPAVGNAAWAGAGVRTRRPRFSISGRVRPGPLHNDSDVDKGPTSLTNVTSATRIVQRPAMETAGKRGSKHWLRRPPCRETDARGPTSRSVGVSGVSAIRSRSRRTRAPWS